MKRNKTSVALAVDEILIPDIEPLQQEYLVDNILDAITKFLKSAVKKSYRSAGSYW